MVVVAVVVPEKKLFLLFLCRLFPLFFCKISQANILQKPLYDNVVATPTPSSIQPFLARLRFLSFSVGLTPPRIRRPPHEFNELSRVVKCSSSPSSPLPPFNYYRWGPFFPKKKKSCYLGRGKNDDNVESWFSSIGCGVAICICLEGGVFEEGRVGGGGDEGFVWKLYPICCRCTYKMLCGRTHAVLYKGHSHDWWSWMRDGLLIAVSPLFFLCAIPPTVFLPQPLNTTTNLLLLL